MRRRAPCLTCLPCLISAFCCAARMLILRGVFLCIRGITRAGGGFSFLPLLLVRFGYATQMPGTATFWNRCGEATAEDGYAVSFALNSGWAKAALKAAVDSQTA
ncbi:hypothetical protein EV132_102542 [Rhizobium sullae]|uniref:Uncharacterized protein n=1 Tax=Rhizobium sullae TaxID=50338 RepID=A0A4R3QD48_RHISU|nr:hypothetical protein EV132_102542 [Rhizobium sullae]